MVFRPPHADPRIDRNASVGKRDHGIEIELRDRREVFAEACEPVNKILERLPVGRGRTTEARHQPASLADRHELFGVDISQRGNSEGGLADELGEHTPWAEGDERTKTGS